MPSPFPGMNPYLEHPHVCADFHNAYLTFLRSAVRIAVEPGYFVLLQQHICLRDLEEDDEPRRVGIGDESVGTRRGTKKGPRVKGGVTAPAQAVLPRFVRESVNYLEVVDRNDERVVTVIELLSPSNKATGNDRDSFLDKRRALVTSHASYVELDFLRGGRGCRSDACRRATTTRWSPARGSGRPPTSGQSDSATSCRRSHSLYGVVKRNR